MIPTDLPSDPRFVGLIRGAIARLDSAIETVDQSIVRESRGTILPPEAPEAVDIRPTLPTGAEPPVATPTT